MLLLKLIAPMVLLLSVVARYVLDYIWHDKRTKWHKRSRIAFLIFQTAAVLITIVVVSWDHKASEEQKVMIQQIATQSKASENASAARHKQSQEEILGLKKQVTDFSERLTPFVTLAMRRYPDLPEDTALERLAREITDVSKRTTSLERSIHTFSASARLLLDGDWIESLPSGRESAIIMPRDDPYIRFVHRSGDRTRDILCYATAMDRRRNPSGQVVVNVEAAVRPGGWPLGKSIDQLTGYDHAEIGVAMVTRDIVKSLSANLKEVTLTIYVNGVPKVAHNDKPNTLISIPSDGRVRVLTLDGRELLFMPIMPIDATK